MRTHILLFFLLGFCTVHGQGDSFVKIDSIKKLDKSNEEKILVFNEYLSVIESNASKKNLGDIYHEIGLLYFLEEKYEKAIEQTSKAIVFKEDSKETPLKSLNKSRYNNFFYYSYQGQPDEGIKFLEETVKSGSQDRFVYKSYIDFSIFYRERGDYFTALEYLKLITEYGKCKDTKTLRNAHLESILVYRKMDNSELYLNEIEKHKNALENLYSSEELASMHNNLGVIFFDIDDYQGAIKMFHKALPVYTQAGRDEAIGIIWNNLGSCYSNLKQSRIANEYYDKGLEISKDKKTLADINNNIGYYLETRNSLDKVPYYVKALCLILELKPEDCNINKLPTLQKIKESDKEYWDDVLFYLTNLSKNWVEAYHEQENQIYLIKAKETLYLIDQLVSLIRDDSSTDTSKLFWIKEGVDVYMLAVEVCYLLNDVDEAFYFMERNKALLLLENLDKTVLREYRSIPKELRKKEDELERKIKRLKIQIQEYPDQFLLKKNFLLVNHELLQLKDSLKLTYPVLDKMKSQVIFSVSENLKELVKADTIFVEYILSEDKGFGLFSSSEGVSFFEIDNPKKVQNDVVSLKKMMSVPFKEKIDFEIYQEKAIKVFDALFPFPNARKAITDKHLKVVPDNVLHGLPFAALVVSENEDSIELDYLLNHTEITYLHSAAVYNRLSTQKSNGKIVGFSPTFFSKNNMPDLLGSEKGMKNYDSFLPMELMLRERATKEEFLSNLEKDNSIVHINSHAGLNDDEVPWLALSDEIVLLEEIYNLNIRTKHVILDACQTGLGENVGGEGIMSLSRALFYSGVESVVASQWNMNEKSNNKILQAYYHFLKEGKTKSYALNTAQRNYITDSELSQKSPYYWASLTLTGASDSVSLQGDNSIWYILIVGFLVIILLFFARKYVVKSA